MISTSLIKEICEIKPPKAESKKFLNDNDLVSFVPMNNLGINTKELLLENEKQLSKVYSGYTYFKDGDVLLAKITPCFENGKLGIASNLKNGVGFGSSEYIVLRSSSKIIPDYLYYFLNRDELRVAGKSVMTGAVGHKRVPVDFIENLEIPLPPLPEQKRIVAILDEAFAAIDKAIANTEKNLANAKELFESYLNSVFSQRGEGWVEKKLGDVVAPTCTLSYGIVQPGKDYDNGLPVVRPVDLKQKHIGLEGLKLIDPNLANSYQRTKLSGKELLLCVRGTTGSISIATSALKGANVTRGIVPIMFDKKSINQYFGYYLFRSAVLQRQISKHTYGAALMQINIRDVRNLTIRFPTLEIQESIVKSTDSTHNKTAELKNQYISKLYNLSELKQSILQKAFTGELTNTLDKTLAEAGV